MDRCSDRHPLSAALRRAGDETLLSVRVTPGASRAQIGGAWTDGEGRVRLCVRVTSPPDKGRANRQLCEIVARALGLPKSAASIRAGEKDRLKTLALKGDGEAIAEAVGRLLAGPDDEGKAKNG